MSYTGAEVFCNIHQASTKVSATEKDLPQWFTVPCAYCLVEENRRLIEENRKLKSQRDTLVDAIDIAKTVKELK